jgi:hypothetical protein
VKLERENRHTQSEETAAEISHGATVPHHPNAAEDEQQREIDLPFRQML